MLCSYIETNLDVKVACKQSWGKQLLLLVLWTSTRKEEGFDLFMQRRLYKSSGLFRMVPKHDAGRSLWRVMLKQSLFGITSLCGQELLSKGKIRI